MSRKKAILLADAVVNLLLGVLLVDFNPGLAETLGVPASDTRFSPSLLGAVFIGVTLALVMALKDYRDVLVGAEYPLYWKKSAHDLTEEEKQEIIARDWDQYTSWLHR